MFIGIIGALLFLAGLSVLVISFVQKVMKKPQLLPKKTSLSMVAIGVVLFFVGVIGSEGDDAKSETVSESSSQIEKTSSSTEDSAASQEAAAESKAKAESESIAKAESESIAKAEAESIKAEQDKPKELSGVGDTVTESLTLKSGFAVITASHDGGSNFALKAYGPSDEELLVNEIGTYNGKTLLMTEAGDYKFEVAADGNWNLSISQVIPDSVEGGSISGHGDDVRFISLEKGSYTVKGNHTGESNFAVLLNGSNLLFNEIGNYSGEKIQRVNDSSTYVVSVTADGDWSIEFVK